jgi:predicted nucleic acid-binding protein
VTFLLDTNIISDLMRADQRIERWMAGLDEGDRIVTCTIVRGEILFGISRLPEGLAPTRTTSGSRRRP